MTLPPLPLSAKRRRRSFYATLSWEEEARFAQRERELDERRRARQAGLDSPEDVEVILERGER